jgi:hypothetical protein
LRTGAYALTAGGHLYDLSRVRRDGCGTTCSTRTRSAIGARGLDTVYAGFDDGRWSFVSIGSGNLVRTSLATPGAVGALASAGDLILAAHAGRSGDLAALRHTEGTLTEVVSPSRLNVGVALFNFAIAAAIVGLLAAGFAALEARVRARRGEETT